MKVKMLEYYQDAQLYFAPDEIADVSASLGAWMIEHRKAVAVIEESKPVEVAEEQSPRQETRKSRRGNKHESDNSISND